MKKVISITLGGIVFAIEQDAYDALAAYLQDIKQHLSGGDDYAEIAEDIEGAIAEKLIAKKRNEKLAVRLSDIESIIQEMGSPSDFNDDPAADDRAEEKTAAKPKTNEQKKRLYRDTDDAVIAGVASGLARYFNIDPVIVRLIFLATLFFNGLGLLAYLVLWLVVPAAETTADKYAMRGERVTLGHITERVKKNIDSIDKADIVTAKSAWSSIRGMFVKLFEVIGFVVRALIKLLRYVVGLVFVFGGALGTAGLISAYTIVLLSDKTLLPEKAQLSLEIILGSTFGVIGIVASFVMIAVPLQVIIITGASLLAKRNYFTATKSVTLAIVWMTAVILTITASALQAEQVIKQFDYLEEQKSNPPVVAAP